MDKAHRSCKSLRAFVTYTLFNVIRDVFSATRRHCNRQEPIFCKAMGCNEGETHGNNVTCGATLSNASGSCNGCLDPTHLQTKLKLTSVADRIGSSCETVAKAADDTGGSSHGSQDHSYLYVKQALSYELSSVTKDQMIEGIWSAHSTLE